MKNRTIKIVISGAESSGKSTLTKQLAEHYDMPYIAEIQREYVENLGREYTFQDVEKIAHLQIETEKKLVALNPEMLFIDVDLINTKYWFSDVYNQVPEWIEKEIESNKPSLHLLCYYDLPWVYDPVRENGHRREYFYNLYKSEIERLGIPFGIVTGTGEERLQNAIKIIEEFIR